MDGLDQAEVRRRAVGAAPNLEDKVDDRLLLQVLYNPSASVPKCIFNI